MAMDVFWPALLFGVSFAGSLGLFVAIVVLLPARYFATNERRFLANQPPLVRMAGLIGKNLLGAGLIGLGVLLSLPMVPGQGLLTMLIGLMLLDVPGKHRLTRRIIGRPGVLKSLNRIRGWCGRGPFVLEGEERLKS